MFVDGNGDSVGGGGLLPGLDASRWSEPFVETTHDIDANKKQLLDKLRLKLRSCARSEASEANDTLRRKEIIMSRRKYMKSPVAKKRAVLTGVMVKLVDELI